MSTLSPSQRRFISSTLSMPDGISLPRIKDACSLLKEGKYPWGTSRRVYIDKPGTDKKRPVTIPPFMDRVIQHSIKTVLECVYEPFFEYLNCSFGFRTHKGCHDAIYSLTNPKTNGMNIAIEGDIKGAYDKVDRSIFINIINKRIRDRKFIRLIEDRLDYQYFDSEKGEYIDDKEGIPQGGIDSPYIWNIYMHEFDVWINKYLDNYFKEKIFPITKYNVGLKDYQNQKGCLKRDLKKLNKEHNSCRKNGEKYQYYYEKYSTIRDIKFLNHKIRNIDTIDPNKKPGKFVYCRYADDWIILFSGSEMHASAIKDEISNWLYNNLRATLSLEKTLITKLKDKNKCAHFLGFELQGYMHNKFSYMNRGINLGERRKKIAGKSNRVTGHKRVLSKIAGSQIICRPDRQRLLNRFYMKGYCDKSGFPLKVGWLTTMEPHIIIERYNSVILGMFNYYQGFISRISDLNRWIYILRYSCFKTLACKYRLTISKLFKKYRIGTTIGFKAIIKTKGKEYSKQWTLLTYMELVTNKLNPYAYKDIENCFYFFKNNKDPKSFYQYYSNSKPSVKDLDFLEKFNWVNVRTQANFDFPCAMCGAVGRTEMHHIKHVRKNKYATLKTTLDQVMQLRNRRQVPLCKACHDKVHAGKKTTGPRLINLSIPPIIYTNTNMYDNKIINLENYIRKGDTVYENSLEDKGWKLEKDLTNDQE